MVGWTSSSWAASPSHLDKQFNHGHLSSGSKYVHLRGELDQRGRAHYWRNLTEYSSPYKVGLTQMIQHLLKAVVCLADFHSNVCLNNNVRFLSQIVWCALSFNKRCTICISPSLAIQSGKRLVKLFLFIVNSIVEIRFRFRFFYSAFGLSPNSARNAFKAMVSTISR